MTTKTTTAKSAKNTGKTFGDVLRARIIRTGKTAAGDEKAVLRFEDGTEGQMDYQYVRTLSVEQGKKNKALLESLGYKLWMSCVAGLFGSSTYEGPTGDFVEISNSHMGRILTPLSEGGRVLDIVEIQARQVPARRGRGR